MCIKLPLRDLNPNPCHHTPQALILVEWLSHQGYAMELNSLLNRMQSSKKTFIYIYAIQTWRVYKGHPFKKN